MTNPKNYDGARFGRLLVLKEANSDFREYPNRPSHRTRRMHCICDCGKRTTVNLNFLKLGRSKSCGCFSREITSKTFFKHGEAIGGKTSEYKIWKHMRARCENPKDSSYQWYGARGIKVCERWQVSFESFLSDMGRRPSRQHSIDRTNNDGDYAPENCRWATTDQQNQNRRLPSRSPINVAELRALASAGASADAIIAAVETQLAAEAQRRRKDTARRRERAARRAPKSSLRLEPLFARAVA